MLEAENAAPDAIQGHRDDRRSYILHDALEPAAEREQLADACDLALGEDADEFTCFNCIAGGLERLEHLARPLFRRNRDHAHDARQWFYIWQLINPFEHE